MRKYPPPALLLFGFAVLLYANTLSFQYAHDDTLLITGNSFTRRGFGGIGDILYHDSFVGFLGEEKNELPGGRYRPLAQVWFAVEYGLFGPNPFIGHLTLALCYANLGRVDAGIDLLNRVVAVQPRSDAAYNALGQIYGRFLNDVPRALTSFTRAYEINRTDASILQNLGVAHALGNDFERAASSFAAAIALRPDDPELHNAIGNAYLRLGRSDLARGSFTKMRELQSRRR